MSGSVNRNGRDVCPICGEDYGWWSSDPNHLKTYWVGCELNDEGSPIRTARSDCPMIGSDEPRSDVDGG